MSLRDDIKLSLNETILLKWLLDECQDIGSFQDYPTKNYSLKLLPFNYKDHLDILSSVIEKGLLEMKQTGGYQYKLRPQAIPLLNNSYDIFNSESRNLTDTKIKKVV